MAALPPSLRYGEACCRDAATSLGGTKVLKSDHGWVMMAGMDQSAQTGGLPPCALAEGRAHAEPVPVVGLALALGLTSTG